MVRIIAHQTKKKGRPEDLDRKKKTVWSETVDALETSSAKEFGTKGKNTNCPRDLERAISHVQLKSLHKSTGR